LLPKEKEGVDDTEARTRIYPRSERTISEISEKTKTKILDEFVAEAYFKPWQQANTMFGCCGYPFLAVQQCRQSNLSRITYRMQDSWQNKTYAIIARARPDTRSKT